jgi:sec-independent protein translocase protein TatB
MFDIGFSEILLVLVIALIVVGPERLPGLARTTGLWIGKIRGFVASVKAEIDHELAAEELRKTLAKQATLPGLEELVETDGTRPGGNRPADKAAPADKRPDIDTGNEAGTPTDDPGKNASRDVMDDNKR